MEPTEPTPESEQTETEQEAEQEEGEKYDGGPIPEVSPSEENEE